MAHFFYIHGSLPTHFKNIFEGHVATQYMNGEGRPDIGDPGDTQMLGTTSVASYFGPSFMIDDLTYHYTDADHKTVLINCHYPIDANSFVLQYGIIVKKSEALPGDLALETAIGLGDFVKMGFEQDVEIWKNKARIDNPLLCRGGRPGLPASPLVRAVLRRRRRCGSQTWWTGSNTSSTPPARTRSG